MPLVYEDRRIRLFSLAVLVLIGMMLFGVLGVVWQSGHTLMTIRHELNDHQNLSNQKLLQRAQIITELGYDGLIDHYHEFLKTGDTNPYEELKGDVADILRAIELYSVLNIQQNERSALETLRRAVIAYEVSATKAYSRQAAPPLTGDDLTAERKSARLALKVLEKHWQTEETVFRKRLSSMSEHAQLVSEAALLAIPFLLLVGVLVMWMAKRLLETVESISGAQKLLAEQADRMQLAEYVSHIGHWQIDFSNHQVLWSEGMYRLCGLSSDTFTPSMTTPIGIVHPEDADWVRSAVDAASEMSDKSFEFEFRLAPQDGRNATHVYVNGHCRMDNGHIIGMFGILQDISKRKKAESLAQRYADELLVRNRELENRNEELNQFAHVASHDLQEPLRMVSSYCDLIAKRYKDRLDEDGIEFLGYAIDGAQRMQELIRDLLSYSRVGRSDTPSAPVNMNTVIETVKDNLKDTLVRRQGSVHVPSPLPVIMGHERDIARMMQNLIGNGIKYNTSANPTVTITAAQEGNFYVFAVKDNGIGIHEKFHKRIFEMFKRLHTRDEYSGTGIGLAIVRKVVDIHKGTIDVVSAPNKGTTFLVRIPTNIDHQSHDGGL